MRYFTYLFNRNGIANLENRAGEYLDRIWGNRLRNVEAGDRIYLVGVNRGRVQLIGRFDASENLRVCGEILGRSTPIRLDCFLEPAIASRLRFVTKKLAVPPVISDGDIDPQTLRGLRQVTLASAALLDQCLGDVDVSGPFVSNTKRRALSVRQPWAELIMRGIKQIEVRSRPTNIRERVFLYASPIHVDVEIERAVDQRYGIDACSLQRGLLVGTVEVVGCRRLEKGDSDHACFRIVNSSGLYAWRLANPERCVPPLRPHRRAQPVWFYPFS